MTSSPWRSTIYAIRDKMIKILRITSIAAAILAAVFLVFSAVFGVRGDKEIDKLLNSPGAVEKFNKAKGNKARISKGQTSPLVKQARAFALYLNPPKLKKPSAPRFEAAADRTPRPMGPVSPKFKLMGTSYYPLRPEMSLALIDEPGKGFRWVRQSSKVGHLIFEQIKDGLIVIRDGKRTYEILAERKPKASLIKGEGMSPTTSSGKTSPRPATRQRLGRSTTAQSLIRRRPPRPTQPNAEEITLIQDFVKTVQADGELDEIGSERTNEEVTAKMKKFISDLKAMRVGAEEAKKLSRLGRELKNIRQDPNKARIRRDRDSKVAAEPNRPGKK